MRHFAVGWVDLAAENNPEWLRLSVASPKAVSVEVGWLTPYRTCGGR